MKLHGIFPPLTTPFAPDGSVDVERLCQNISRYNETRLAGYVLNGSTGESVLLTWDEVERIWAAARQAASPEKVLIAGTGAESTAETIEHTRRAAGLGYQAALVRTPHYYKPQMSDEVEAEYFLRVADAAPIPILIYSVPAFTGLAVGAALAERLSRHPNIIGIKDSSGDVHRASEVVGAAQSGFQTLVGSASTLYASLSVGAVGAILAVACAFPEHCVELYEAARAGRVDKAQALQESLVAFSALVSRLGVPGLKYALDQLGYYGGPVRPPLLPVNEAAAREINGVLANLQQARSAADD
jgi:4-hydroxy-2-oxoglutarate aldolase